jgi:zinc transport system permease protein
MRLGKSFNVVIAISIGVGFIGMLSGLTSSFYLDTPPGATITLVFIVLFLVVNLFKRVLVSIKRKNK